MDWLIVDERLFFGFLLFFFVHYFNYLKDLYFYIFILLLKWSNFSLMFLSLILLICQWMSEFNLRTVRAIAKARKIVQISICVFDLQRYVYVILSKIKMTVSFFKRMLFIFRCFVILIVVYRREKKSKSEIYILRWFLMMTHCFVKIVEYFHLTSIQKEKWWNFEKG